MDKSEIEAVVRNIADQSTLLKNKYLRSDYSPIDWICIFCQSETEYKEFIGVVKSLGKVIQDTGMGPIYKLNRPIKTEAGNVVVLKIRKPDKTRTQRGDGDYRIGNFALLKRNNLSKKQFSLVQREDYEMVEIRDPDFDVLVYFSNPPITKVLGVKK